MAIFMASAAVVQHRCHTVLLKQTESLPRLRRTVRSRLDLKVAVTAYITYESMLLVST